MFIQLILRSAQIIPYTFPIDFFKINEEHLKPGSKLHTPQSIHVLSTQGPKTKTNLLSVDVI